MEGKISFGTVPKVGLSRWTDGTDGIIRIGANMPNLLGEGASAKQGGFLSFDTRSSQNAIAFWTKQPGSSTETESVVITNGGIKIICPSGFTSVEAQNRQLGCIQNTEEGSGNYDTAVNDCFTTYGGRLPSYAEINIAFNNYALSYETDDREWVDAAYGGGAATVIREDGRSGGTAETSSEAYRCWLPK